MAIPFSPGRFSRNQRVNMRRERRASLDIPTTPQASFGDLSLSSQMMYLAMMETWRILKAVMNGEEVENQIDFDPTGHISEEGSLADSQEDIESDVSSDNEDEKTIENMYQHLNVRRMSLPARMPDIIENHNLFNISGKPKVDDIQYASKSYATKIPKGNQENHISEVSENAECSGSVKQELLPDFVPGADVSLDFSPELLLKTNESGNNGDDFDGVPNTIYHRKNDSQKPFRVNNQWLKQQGFPHQSVKFANPDHDDRLLSDHRDQREGQVRLWRQTGKDLHRIAMSRQHGLEDNNSAENGLSYTLRLENEFNHQEARNVVEGQMKASKKLTRRNSDINRTKDFVDGSRRNRRFSVAGTSWIDNAHCHQNQVIGKNQGQKSILSDICTMISVFGLYICVRKIEKLFK